MPPLPVKVKSLTLSPFCVTPQSSPLTPALILAGAAQAGAARDPATSSKAAARKKARQVIFPSTFADASLAALRPKPKLCFTQCATGALRLPVNAVQKHAPLCDGRRSASNAHSRDGGPTGAKPWTMVIALPSPHLEWTLMPRGEAMATAPPKRYRCDILRT